MGVRKGRRLVIRLIGSRRGFEFKMAMMCYEGCTTKLMISWYIWDGV